jgi:hypothetical protein
MVSLVIPEKVVLRLVDSRGDPFRVANVLFFVRAFATTRKNNFRLGPFVTDAEGMATITKRDLLAEATANITTGIMDYDPIESCGPIVEIAAMEPQEIEKALEARTTIWKRLLIGESERWTSIEELRNVYRTAANKSISAKAIRVRWDGSANEYQYAFSTAFR